MFCREALADVSALQKQDAVSANDVRIVFVHMGTETQAAALFSKYDVSEMDRISDPQQILYRAFEIPSVGLLRMFQPATVLHGLIGLWRGHGAGKPVGNPTQAGAVFLLDNNGVQSTLILPDIHQRPDYLALLTAAASDS